MKSVLVCGGRDFYSLDIVKYVLFKLHKKVTISRIIEGGAQGADSCANSVAKMFGLPVTTVEANWTKYGKQAGVLRNIEMLSLNPDIVVAFPGGTGTRHMKNIALETDAIVLAVDICHSLNTLHIANISAYGETQIPLKKVFDYKYKL